MPFVSPTDTAGQQLNTMYAEHITQFVKVLTGLLDSGQLSLLPPVASPASAPIVTLTAGALSGSYQWGTYWITGIPDGTGAYSVTGRTLPSAYSAAQTLATQEGTVSIAGETIPTGVVGWGSVRNKAGGATWYEVPGSEQFLNGASAMPTTFVDNVADTSLVTAAPATNTTGTSWAESTLLGYRAMLPDYDQYASSPDANDIYTVVQYKRPDATLYMQSTLSNPDVNGNYQTDTWQFYDSAGTTVTTTHVWTITYDTYGRPTQKVMTS